MSEEIVSVVVGGTQFFGWEKVAVNLAADKAARSFALTAADGTDLGAAFSFLPDQTIDVYAGDDLLLHGWIEQLIPSFEAANHTIEVSGRSKSADAVESSANHKTGELKNKNLLQIAKEIDDTGVKYTTDTDLKTIDKFRLNPGETVFEALDRLAKYDGVLLMGQADGSIMITKGGSKGNVHPPLVEGVNILGGSATYDFSGKAKKVKIRGQHIFGQSSKNSLRIGADATNPAMQRNITKSIVGERDLTGIDQAKERASNHLVRQQAQASSASIKVQGWRDANGAIWTPNSLVFVNSQALRMNQTFAIKDVSLTQDSSGTIAQLSLVDPRSLHGKTSPGKKAASSSAAPSYPDHGFHNAPPSASFITPQATDTSQGDP